MSNVATEDTDVARLLNHAHRIEREGKKEIAEVIYTAASEIARLRQERDPRAFVDFVLRHTLPERARAHGPEAIYNLMRYHPFAKALASPPTGAEGKTE